MDYTNLSYYKAFFSTPPLWTGELDGLGQFEFPEVGFENFVTVTIPSNLRLGHKIEHIFLQLIQHSPQYKVVAHNIPIRKEKISLGEIDFLLQDVDSQKFMHVELTYKFYVIPENTIPIERQLIGPNKRDSFYAKKERIINHQIPLLKTPEGISALHRFNIRTSELQHQVCFKSQLFIPFMERNMDVAPLNANCISGKWISFQKFNSSVFFSHKYYIPTKPEWLLEPHLGVKWQVHSEILDLISNRVENKNSPLLWMKSDNLTIEKLFILWW
ncbi:DUF1853 family protein [Arenibacter sp. F20364]|uniref:DUF1853 family protein n=1 Tax=Arenibacter sp. F20364 TaxID=2926415 RepID=UPI001FF50759|nr:DUF1853 family protein [Arenibacter sp. F20364]MCK0191122.1 DUF1853 family protein [Arenibacter sp. F20364]